MEANLPAKIDQSFLEEILRKGTKNDALVVEKYSIQPATAVGDGYMSQMFRATVQLRNKQDMSLIIKMLPKGENMKDFIHNSGYFDVEGSVLTEAMPRIHTLLSCAGMPKYLSAKVYFQQGPPDDLIVMEDLSEEGFTTADRQLGLDMDHARLVLVSLANLHAGSLALHRLDPMAFTPYYSGFWTKENEKNITLTILDAIRVLGTEIGTWENTPKEYGERVKKVADVLLEKMYHDYDRDEGVNVLLHGDSWTKNLMFQYEDGKPVSMKFVDFQLASYRSPALDILYFFFTSPTDNLSVQQIPEYLRIYHSALHEACDKLQLKLDYSFSKLEQEFHKRLFFGFMSAAWIFPITTAPTNSVIDCEALLDESNTSFTNIGMYRSERFKRIFRGWLPYFIEHGVI